MADIASQQPAKPGTACLGCRRRKLKCSREQSGCVNCTKADLPCVYPAPETGVKRKRGPYKKDKPPRERHLEHLVKYLEPRNLGNALPSGDHAAFLDAHASSGGAAPTEGLSETLAGRNEHSEDLVKDALIALTKSSVTEREATAENGGAPQIARQDLAYRDGSAGSSSDLHPPLGHVFEYWHLFVTRVDPMTKVIHCPTFAKQLVASVTQKRATGAAIETLLFSIYYIAVCTCTASEARHRFGESRDALLQRYSHVVEATLASNYGTPAIESIQALVLYIIGLRRQDDGTSVSALFALAVRMAQMMGLHEDPGSTCRPFEAQYRRRLWWHLCGLESRGAEESGVRSTSIMEGRDVQFPANLNDYDLEPNNSEIPQPRAGVTDTTFVRLRWEVHRLVHRIWSAKRQKCADGQQKNTQIILEDQRHLFEEAQQRLEDEYAQYFHKSRPFDWMCSSFFEGMLVKTKMVIEYPFGQVPTKDMSSEERFELLQSSVAIISITHLLAVDKRIEEWRWFFAGWVQWHSLAIVVAELGRSTNKQFTRSAWAVLDPILADWDKMYRSRQGEPAWDHVNTLIVRAKYMRYQAEKSLIPTPQHTTKTVPRQNPPSPQQEHSAKVAPSSVQYIAPAMEFAYPAAAGMPQRGSSSTPQQAPTPHSLDDQNSAQQPVQLRAPSSWDVEADLGSFDGLYDIDFGAFDAVFGSEAWQFPSTLGDSKGIDVNHDPLLQTSV